MSAEAVPAHVWEAEIIRSALALADAGEPIDTASIAKRLDIDPFVVNARWRHIEKRIAHALASKRRGL